MVKVLYNLEYDFTTASRFILYAEFLKCIFNKGLCSIKEMKERRIELVDECVKEFGGKRDCTIIVSNGLATFCQWTDDVPYCKENANLKLVAAPTTTTTTTTTTEAPATTSAPFPIGTLIGGFSVGAFLGAVLMILILFMCRKSKKSYPDSGYPTATTPTGSTGTTGTTTGTTTTKTEKKKKGKKNKKGKKAKKNKKSTTQLTETKTATAY